MNTGKLGIEMKEDSADAISRAGSLFFSFSAFAVCKCPVSLLEVIKLKYT